MALSELATQLDYPEDLKFQNEIHLKLAPDFGDCFGIEETVAVLNKFRTY